jgi:hypothetical protein
MKINSDNTLFTSVADPGCLSRILIFIHPGSGISDPVSRIPDLGSRIPDPKTATNITKLKKKNFSEPVKQKILSSLQRIIEIYTQKIVIRLSKYGVGIRDSEKNLFRIPDQGVKKALDPGSGSATLLFTVPVPTFLYLIPAPVPVTGF